MKDQNLNTISNMVDNKKHFFFKDDEETILAKEVIKGMYTQGDEIVLYTTLLTEKKTGEITLLYYESDENLESDDAMLREYFETY